MTRVHFASRVEDRLNAATGSVLAKRGWSLRILPFVGYGAVDPAHEGLDPTQKQRRSNTSVWHGDQMTKRAVRRVPEGGSARILARVVLAKDGQPEVPAAANAELITRGASAFFSVPLPGESEGSFALRGHSWFGGWRGR